MNTCPVCKQVRSANARTCPHCGDTKTTLGGVLLAIIVGLLIAGFLFNR